MSGGIGSCAESGDDDLRAAEYVLGTLPAAERAEAEAERARAPAFAAAIRAWERRLAPLAAAIPPVAPDPGLWSRLAAALPGAAANDNQVTALAAQVRRWRLATAGAGLVAAGLALALLAGPQLASYLGIAPTAPAARYVAVVTSGGTLPALIVSVDTAQGIARVRPLAAEAPAGRSLELWYVGGAGAAPRTLGLLGADAGGLRLPVAGDALGAGVLAVSVEPPGGSPTGQPTGPVIYSGKLIRE